MAKQSKISYPAAVNETLYLSFDEAGSCTAISKDEIIYMRCFDVCGSVADLNAHLQPATTEDRDYMISALQTGVVRAENAIKAFGDKKPRSKEGKIFLVDTTKGIERMQKELERLSVIKI